MYGCVCVFVSLSIALKFHILLLLIIEVDFPAVVFDLVDHFVVKTFSLIRQKSVSFFVKYLDIYFRY